MKRQTNSNVKNFKNCSAGRDAVRLFWVSVLYAVRVVMVLPLFWDGWATVFSCRFLFTSTLYPLTRTSLTTDNQKTVLESYFIATLSEFFSNYSLTWIKYKFNYKSLEKSLTNTPLSRRQRWVIESIMVRSSHFYAMFKFMCSRNKKDTLKSSPISHFPKLTRDSTMTQHCCRKQPRFPKNTWQFLAHLSSSHSFSLASE